MIKSIPATSFGSGAKGQVANEQMYNSGMYPQPIYVVQEPPRKKGGLIRFIGKLLITAGVVAGGAFAARKLIPALKKDVYKVADEVPTGFKEKVKHYTARIADFVEEKSVGLYNKLFKGKKAEEVAEAAK